MYRIAMKTPDKGIIYACHARDGIQAWTKNPDYDTFPTVQMAEIERDDRLAKGHILAGNTLNIERAR